MNMIADNSFESLFKVEVNDGPDAASGESQLERFRASSGLLFLEPGREEALRLIGHLLRYSDQLIAVVGAGASGKNYLLRAFAEANEETLSFGFVQAEQFMSASALSACIGQKLASRLAYVGDLDEWSAQIVSWSEELENAGSRAVIVIDEAQHLSESALEMLADLILACAGSVGIRFILMGTPELREHLDHSRLVGQLLGKCHFIDIEPFDAQTSAHFLSWSLASHSLTPDLFTADERRYILQRGKGLPGLIREAAIQVMDKGIPSSESDREPAALSPVAGLLRTKDERSSRGPTRKRGVAIAGLVLAICGIGALITSISGTEDGIGPAPASEVVRVQAPDIVPGVVEPVRQGSERTAERELAVADKAAVAEPRSEAQSFQLPSASTAAGAVSQPEAGGVAKLDPKADATVIENAVQREEFLAKRELPDAGPRSADWLLEKSPETYVLQMLGTHSESGARRYISEQDNQQSFALFATRMNGKPWYVVVYGHHPDRPAALAAIQRLPKKLRDRKPWARSLESVHKAILEGRHA